MSRFSQSNTASKNKATFTIIKTTISAVIALLVQLCVLPEAYSQMAGPADNKGTTSKSLGQIDLKDEIQGMEGRQLRSRYITIEPGGHSSAHSHAGRPTLEYIAQGNVIEIRNGVETPHSQGEMVIATHDISHWWENRGTEKVVLIPIDIFKP